MSWVRLDDSMPHHPKLAGLGVQAFALDVAALCYSSRFGTDGYVSEKGIAYVLPSMRYPRHWAEALVEAGRWKRDLERGGWIIHDFHEYQPSAAEAEALRRARVEAGRKGGQASAQARASTSGTQANGKQVVQASAEANSEGLLNPVPSRPVPSRLFEKKSSERARWSATRTPTFDAFWSEYPRHSNEPAARWEWSRLEADLGLVMEGLERWLAYWEQRGEPQFTPGAATWLARGDWAQDPPQVVQSQSRSEQQQAAAEEAIRALTSAKELEA